MSKKNFYAVRRGHKPGIYTEWSGPDGAEAQVKGFSNPQYRKFKNRFQAEVWLKGEALPETLRLQGFETYLPEEPPSEQPLPAEEIDAAQALASGKVVLYTDGGCIGNPGPGGYGVVLLYKGHRKELSGGYRLTTNNRVELMACIAGLQALKVKSSVVLFSDSLYVVNGIVRGSARRWKARGWMRSKKSQAENPDLWEKLLEVCDQHEVQFAWVKGHAGDRENERCDQLAMQAARRSELPSDQYFEDHLANSASR